jgi:hypothetical protein
MQLDLDVATRPGKLSIAGNTSYPTFDINPIHLSNVHGASLADITLRLPDRKHPPYSATNLLPPIINDKPLSVKSAQAALSISLRTSCDSRRVCRRRSG